jgi:hypothetical protein
MQTLAMEFGPQYPKARALALVLQTHALPDVMLFELVLEI